MKRHSPSRAVLSAIALSCVCLLNAADSPIVTAAKLGKPWPRPESKPTVDLVGKAAPKLEITARYNTRDAMALARLRGRVVLLEFWNMTCGPCIKGFPVLHSISDARKNQPFSIILVHTQFGTEFRKTLTERRVAESVPAADVLPATIAKHGVRLPVAVADGETFDRYGVRGVPLYVLIDKQGIVRHQKNEMPAKDLIDRLLR